VLVCIIILLLSSLLFDVIVGVGVVVTRICVVASALGGCAGVTDAVAIFRIMVAECGWTVVAIVGVRVYVVIPVYFGVVGIIGGVASVVPDIVDNVAVVAIDVDVVSDCVAVADA